MTRSVASPAPIRGTFPPRELAIGLWGSQERLPESYISLARCSQTGARNRSSCASTGDSGREWRQNSPRRIPKSLVIIIPQSWAPLWASSDHAQAPSRIKNSSEHSIAKSVRASLAISKLPTKCAPKLGMRKPDAGEPLYTHFGIQKLQDPLSKETEPDGQPDQNDRGASLWRLKQKLQQVPQACNSGRKLSRRRNDADFVHSAAGDIHPAVGGRHHVADHTSARRNLGARERLRFRIELYDGVRLHPGFAVPHHAVRSDSDAIGVGFRPPGRWVELHAASGSVQRAEMPALEVAKVNRIVCGDGQAAGTHTYRKRILLDGQGLRINRGHLVGAQLAKDRHALAVNLNAIRQRSFGGNFLQFDLSSSRITPPDHVAALHGEPQNPAAIENRGVRIVGLLNRHFVLSHDAGARIELPDVPAKIRSEPDVALLVGNQSVRACIFVGRKWVLLHLAGLWIEPAKFVGHLLGKPQRSVGSHRGIVRMPALARHRPLLNRHLELGHVRGRTPLAMHRQRQRENRTEAHQANQRNSSVGHRTPPVYGRTAPSAGYTLSIELRNTECIAESPAGCHNVFITFAGLMNRQSLSVWRQNDLRILRE